MTLITIKCLIPVKYVHFVLPGVTGVHIYTHTQELQKLLNHVPL